MTEADMSFYKGRKVLVTGHTGFKGSWMTKVLLLAGAEVSGYALEPPTEPSLFKQMNLAKDMNSLEGQKAYCQGYVDCILLLSGMGLLRQDLSTEEFMKWINR